MKNYNLKMILGFIVLILSINTSLSTEITVNSAQTTIADDGLCTLFEAVNSANDNEPSGTLPGECLAGETFSTVDQIIFDNAMLPVTITIPYTLLLTESVSIRSPHQDLVTLQSEGLNRIMKIDNSVGPCEFEIKGITFDGGLALLGDLEIGDFGYGGAIYISMSASTLLIDAVKFTNNSAYFAGGALAFVESSTTNVETTIKNSTFEGNFSRGLIESVGGINGGGGAIYIANNQVVTIEDSTFVGNSTHIDIAATTLDPQAEPSGGAILTSTNIAFPTLVTIRRSTFSQNASVGYGGAISVGHGSTDNEYAELSIRHSTVVYNQSDTNQNSTIKSTGGGLYSSSNFAFGAQVYNSIISLNNDNSATPAHNLTGQLDSLGYNFINNNLGALVNFQTGSPNINNDFSFLQVQGVTPKIEDLYRNGGLTATHELMIDSLAVDSGNCPMAANDQRGHVNPNTNLRAFDQVTIPNFSDGCDIGAFELGTDFSNYPPDVQNDNYTVLEDNILDVNGISPNFGLLFNDSDLENGDLFVLNAGVFEPNSLFLSQRGEIDLSVDGLLSYTPDQDENGVVYFVYSVSDGLNTSFGTATINIKPINDQPGFTVNQHSINVTQTGIVINIPNWATQISNGPLNESSQQSQFQINVIQGNNGFFNQAPAINATTGDLTFEVSPSANGLVELEITLRDNGGTSFGGIDTSVSQIITFSINQNAPVINIITPNNGDSSNFGDLINFTATANDTEDGDITAGLLWRSDLDGQLGTSGNFSLSTLSVGAHIITAKVTDSSGITVTQDVEIQVNSVLTAPIVTILNPSDASHFVEGLSVDFEGVAMDAEDGNITGQISWSSNIDGPLGTGGVISAQNLRIGQHVISAKITDTSGLSSIASVVIFIDSSINAPVLTIIQPVSGSIFTSGEPILFNASAIDLEDGDISAGITWSSILEGMVIGTGASFSLSNLSLGTHIINISVTDSNNNTSIDSVAITIREAISPPTLSLTSPANGSSFFENDMITFSATASDLEDGDITAQISWYSNIDGEFGIGSASFINSSLTIGTHQIIVSIIDSDGEIDSRILILTINQSVTAPVVTVLSPDMNATFQLNENINFIATAFDNEDGDLTAMIIWSNTGIGTIGNGGNINVSNLPVGIHSIRATVKDSNFQNASATVLVEVIETNIALNVNILTPSDGDVFLPGVAIVFTGLSLDLLGDDISSGLSWTSSIDGFLGNGSMINANNLSAGIHEINTTVIDVNGNLGTASINITIINDMIFESGFE